MIFLTISSFNFLQEKSFNYCFSGIINVHASLLPKWRGAMPIVYSIMNGDNVTGITIQKIKPEKFDIGDIVLKKSCTIGKQYNLYYIKF